ncbi:MAG TPA: Gfo/Idh/MocA family oxidoreductase [Bryobacteraceae bacterium]|nr:Gfo/Idh/MocA family oxidoreductase [Bryobacteraceae bacterium]
MDRRRFFQTAAVSLGAAGSVLGANDRVQVAIIGLGGRGRDHIAEYSKRTDCRIAAVCDVNQAAQERAAALVEKLTGSKPRVFSDARKLLADKEIDTVSIATPNHWHALGTIWACQAGKDVYVEKPACHNVYEGRKMVEAARKYKRMVQVGSQSRSIAHKIRAIELLDNGAIGKLYMAKGICYRRRKSIGHTPDTPVPAGIDWDMFLGPARMKPFSENKYKYNWHWFWDTGNGDIGNQGVHEMDVARWVLKKREMPRSVVSTGGKYAYVDDQETPNTQYSTLDFGDCQLCFEVRGLITPPDEGMMVGNIFWGSEGYMTLDQDGYAVYKGEGREKVMQARYAEPRIWDTTPHVATFLKAVRSRNPRDLTADVEEGVLSANLCHVANISYRLGRKLAMDPKTGRFADADANRMLTRDYRAPYVVPERV